MLTLNSDVKTHDELLVEQDKLCAMLESGDSFLPNQDFVFSKKSEEKVKGEDFCYFSNSLQPNEITYNFFKESLILSLRRLDRIPKKPPLMNEVALYNMRIGEFDKAIDILEDALRLDKYYFPAIANLANCYFAKGNVERALSLYCEIDKENYYDIKTISNIALIHFKNKNYDKALEYLGRAEKIDKKNPSVLNNIGLVYLAKGNPHNAISFIRRASKLKSNDYSFYNNLGVCYVAINNDKKALHYFKIAYNLDSSARSILINLTSVYQKLNDHDSVISTLDTYSKASTGDVEVINLLVKSYFELGMYKKCLNLLISSLDNVAKGENESRALIYHNLGIVYMRMKEIQKANFYFTKCLETHSPINETFYYNIIEFYLRYEKLDNAIKLIDDALHRNKDNPILLSFLGQYYFQKNEYDISRETFNKVVALDSMILSAYLFLSTIELEVYENFDNAFNILENGLKAFPNDSRIINNYAYGLLLQNRIEEAKNLLQLSVDNSDNIFSFATNGLLLIKEGKLEEGIDKYNIARANALNDLDYDLSERINQKKFLEIATYHYSRGHNEEAIQCLKKGLKAKTKYNYYRTKIINLLNQLDQ
jgi:tetratricopeptide (TPR) repeat protein